MLIVQRLFSFFVWFIAVFWNWLETFLDSWEELILNDFILLFLGSVNHLLLVVNSSMNFLIYCCMAKRFRTALLDLFRSWRCQWRRHQGDQSLQCWSPTTEFSKIDVNRYNWNKRFLTARGNSYLGILQLYCNMRPEFHLVSWIQVKSGKNQGNFYIYEAPYLLPPAKKNLHKTLPNWINCTILIKYMTRA